MTETTASPASIGVSALPPWSGATAAMLRDGRLHLQHGPIDLLITADGTPTARRAALAAATARFRTLLAPLAAELTLLRRPVAGDAPPSASDPVAKRMIDAVWPHRAVFITPMAAVAGAVADEILAAMLGAADLDRACVNNGGDIALHLAGEATWRVGVVGDLAIPRLDSTLALDAASGIGGIATSGWRGRSQCLGVVDAVTVLAASAAAADAATKPIAMAMRCDHAAVVRRPARAVREDSDLGDLQVVVDVGPLPAEAVRETLDAGAAAARRLVDAGAILGAVLQLQAQWAAVGEPGIAAPP
jgi:ApbE superfamily uncharacterized protein (UPF0280 family)